MWENPQKINQWKQLNDIGKMDGMKTILKYNYRHSFLFSFLRIITWRAILYRLRTFYTLRPIRKCNVCLQWNNIEMRFTLYSDFSGSYFDTFLQWFICVQMKFWQVIRFSLLIFNANLIRKTKITYPDNMNMTYTFPSIKHYHTACMLSRN